LNISSVIVIPQPDRIDAARAALTGVAGVELSAISPEGKMIAIIEADNDQETVRLFELISHLDGVLSASMVFHQQETDPEAEITEITLEA
jgi:nitrate reductase NapD